MTLKCCLAIISLTMSLSELLLLMDPHCPLLWLSNESIQLFTNLKVFYEYNKKGLFSSPSVSTANSEWYLPLLGIKGLFLFLVRKTASSDVCMRAPAPSL